LAEDLFPKKHNARSETQRSADDLAVLVAASGKAARELGWRRSTPRWR